MTGLMELQRCGDAGGKTKAGTPCRSPLGLGENGLCMNHDPARKAAAHELHAAGGRASSLAARARRVALPGDVPKVPKTLDDAVRYFAWLTNAIVTGRLDARSGHEAAFALKGFQSAAEKRDLQAEITKLRAELAAARKATPTSRLGLARG